MYAPCLGQGFLHQKFNARLDDAKPQQDLDDAKDAPGHVVDSESDGHDDTDGEAAGAPALGIQDEQAFRKERKTRRSNAVTWLLSPMRQVNLFASVLVLAVTQYMSASLFFFASNKARVLWDCLQTAQT